MNFEAAMEYIEEKNKLGIVPGLDNIKELLRRLGNPQEKCKALHIAGTNGKGSIFSFVENVLLEAGYKVGRYISPTIYTYLERFQINKINMSKDEFAGFISEIEPVILEMEKDGYSSPTAFEIETAIAFCYFAREECDYMLIECGMGGKLDATNVISKPCASVFAQISMDHMQFLGNTLEEIAKNKADIIKQNSVCISAVQDKTVVDILEKCCRTKNSEFILVNSEDLEIIEANIDKTEFIYKGKKYCIKLLGDHQVINAATAIEVLEKINIKYEAIAYGLSITSWSGRMTKINKSPLIFVDGAHNEAAWSVLKDNINKYFTNKRIIYIIGVLRDKEYEKMVDILCDTMKYAITITPDSPRGLDKKILCDLINKKGIKTDMAENSQSALNKALSYAKDDDVIMVCGSLSFISDYLLWGEKNAQD